jgi:hypothetical protein
MPDASYTLRAAAANCSRRSVTEKEAGLVIVKSRSSEKRYSAK